MSIATATHTFFMEVGTEELPPGFLLTVEDTLGKAVVSRLEAKGIADAEVTIDKTPRRLIITLTHLPEKQADREEDIKGPPFNIAYLPDGSPAKALEGFLKKNNASLDDVQKQDIGGTDYVVVHQSIVGERTQEFIGELVVNAVQDLDGPRWMRWANNSTTFPRPIRWLMAFWDDAPLSVSMPFGNDVLTSGSTTRGHRLLGQESIPISGVDDYYAKLESVGKVQPSTDKRKALIREQLQAKADELGGNVIIDDDLLDEVALILEWPNVLAGKFDASYLTIPRPVLITVMKAHQRYFPLENEHGELLPNFLIATNGDPVHGDTIVAGNERVLLARFEDARFFYDDDMKTPLESRLKDLDGVTFQKGLGTLKDKTQRIQRLSYAFAEALVLDTATKKHIERAALLCKTDLVTSMVFELTELQGEVGMHYAIQQGEDPIVGQAIFEHYLPRFNGDVLPETEAGMVLSLADKLDTLVALFSQSKTKMPSGSKDPLGLRRLVNGVLLTMLLFNVQANLETWCEHTFDNLGNLAQEDWVSTWERIQGFMTQRLQSHLNEKGYAHDVITACNEAFNPWENLPQFLGKVENLSVKRNDAPELMDALYVPANRVDKMIAKHYRSEATIAEVNPDLFEADAERNLYRALAQAVTKNSTVVMMELAPVVQAFFDDVMVMNPDENVKANRIALLSVLHSLYMSRYGRLSCLVV